jgi:glycosyltransferase involved in cell wall biosynthesis
MADKPFLSVVMPVHAGAEWIEATLESVAAEPTDGLEILVIDSSPDDATAAIVERYAERLPLQLLRRPDVTPWQTKTNMGVELARADHACILHQDDLWLPGRVESVRRWIADAPEAVLHLAPSRLIDRHGRRLGRWTCPLPAEQMLDPQFLLQRLLVQNFVSVPAPVFRRSAWLGCGGMDEQLWYTPDWDIWVKLSLAGPVVYHDEMTTAFRLHGSSLTVTGSRDANEFRAQMETVLDRHLGEIEPGSRKRIERLARASIDVNVSLAAVSGGSATALASAAGNLLSLGPVGMSRYLRDSRLGERALSRLRARMTGAF